MLLNRDFIKGVMFWRCRFTGVKGCHIMLIAVMWQQSPTNVLRIVNSKPEDLRNPRKRSGRKPEEIQSLLEGGADSNPSGS